MDSRTASKLGSCRDWLADVDVDLLQAIALRWTFKTSQSLLLLSTSSGALVGGDRAYNYNYTTFLQLQKYHNINITTTACLQSGRYACHRHETRFPTQSLCLPIVSHAFCALACESWVQLQLQQRGWGISVVWRTTTDAVGIVSAAAVTWINAIIIHLPLKQQQQHWQ